MNSLQIQYKAFGYNAWKREYGIDECKVALECPDEKLASQRPDDLPSGV